MPNFSLHRKTALLLLLGLTLALPWPATAGPHREPARQTVTAARPALELAAGLWSFLTSLWGEEGCYIDPDGRCIASPHRGLTGPTDTGCDVDPDGCRAARSAPFAAPADEGCYIDPNGSR